MNILEDAMENGKQITSARAERNTNGAKSRRSAAIAAGAHGVTVAMDCAFEGLV